MRVLNFGSLNVDYTFDVEHFVQAGETISSSALNRYPGGKGLNQSIALARAGAEVVHAGKVGEDGRFLVDILERNGVDVGLVDVREDEHSGCAVIQRDPTGENCIILYGGSNRSIDDSFSEHVFSSADGCEWLLLQNEISNLGSIARMGKRSGMKIALNPSPVEGILDTIDLGLVDLLVLNECEAAALSGVSSEEEPLALMRALQANLPGASIVLTLGSAGSVFVSPGGGPVIQEAFHVSAVDTTGAGDTFTGYFLQSFAQGADASQAMRRAAAAAAIAIGRPGASVSIPSREEVDDFLSRQ